VEVKKTRVGRGSKALHLTYLGDSVLGEKVNIGAGTVTCNYDGEKKHPTTIEEGVFIGSGSMLVAPLRVGRHAYVAAGSTITEDVPAEALAIGRARQVVKEGWTRQKEALKPSLQVTVHGFGEVTVFDVDGRLTLGDPISQLNDEVRPMLGAGRKKIILNLAKVSYVDSAGMGALVGILKAAREVGGQLKLSSLTLKVRVLLETADLDRVFEIYPDEASAMLSFDQPQGS
jgi:anti-anti-sigma factor